MIGPRPETSVNPRIPAPGPCIASIKYQWYNSCRAFTFISSYASTSEDISEHRFSSQSEYYTLYLITDPTPRILRIIPRFHHFHSFMKNSRFAVARVR